MTRSKPKPSELAGTYIISPDGAGFADSILADSSRLALIELRTDHSAVVNYFPNTGGSGKPDLTTTNGQGSWSLEEPSIDGIRINFKGLSVSGSQVDHSDSHFDSVGYGGVLMGHSWPYELYFGVGDPDEGEGIIFQRKR